jgi:hypothetical protein
MAAIAFETFPALEALPKIRAVFIQRVPNLDVRTDRDTAMARLASVHRDILDALGFPGRPVATGHQTHSAHVVRVSLGDTFPVPDCDALVTTDPRIVLGVHVADCAAVYLADRKGRGIALAHSGKKGTELGIVALAIEALRAATGASPEDIIMQISPCIRPPHYEIDFAADIRRQAKQAGLTDIHDLGICTASHPDRYYSYRLEKGRTGRLLAAIAISPP